MILICYHYIMKLLTRDTDYAVRALRYLAQNDDKLVSARELQKKLKTPWPFIRKIMQTLQKKRILTSCKGKNGGFRMAVPAGKIFLVDLIEIFQGRFSLSECLFKKKICPDRDNCLLRQKIESIEHRILGELKAITIDSLLT